MLKSFLNRIKLYFDPPKTGSVYYGNPELLITNRCLELTWHGLMDKHGDPLWEPVPSDRCCRLIIESDAMPTYYRCTSEIFCKPKGSGASVTNGKWMTRCQPRRIAKEMFKDNIINGLLKKEGV
jgi:hypothetical protein